MLTRLKRRLRREEFLTSPLAMVVSPVYIIRDGLYKSILSMASKIRGDILDFGCGSKPYESLFTNSSSYVGVDILASGHSHANSKIDFYYDGKSLPFPDEHFDAVLAFEVFEHIFNLEEVIAEIRRVLKPGGKILISIPFAWDEHEVPYDFARYTSYGIMHIFKRNGFDVLELKKTTTYFLAVCQMFIAYLAQHVFPRSRTFSRLFQFLFIFPLNVMSLLLNMIFPKRYEFFCDCVVFGEKNHSQ